MTRSLPATVAAAALVVLMVAAPLAVAGGFDGAQPHQTTDQDGDMASGARLAGIVGSEGAALSGDLEERSLGHALARANGTEGEAAVVAAASGDIEERIAALRERKATLTERYENGTVDRGEYRARVARLAAQIRTLDRLANRTASAAGALPADALAAHGVNASRIADLRSAAADLAGPEVAAIARNVTVRSDRAGPPDDTRGPPTDAGPGAVGDAGPTSNRTAGPVTTTGGGPPTSPGGGGQAGNATANRSATTGPSA